MLQSGLTGYRPRMSTPFPDWREFRGLDAPTAAQFASHWLPAWSGNAPALLLSYYAENAFYRDPAVPAGLTGLPAIGAYFERLLGQFPDWVWTHTGSTPLGNGFLNRWKADIPTPARAVTCEGVCTVQLNDAGKIIRNEVFFDRSPLLDALRELQSGAAAG